MEVSVGTTTTGQMVDDESLDWLRNLHQRKWTASVCTGGLNFGSRGNFEGLARHNPLVRNGLLGIIGAFAPMESEK